MSRHLVTGGAGFIGSRLANRLAADGHEVTAFDRFSRGKHARLDDSVQVVEGDIRNYPDLLAADVSDTIWHLAYVQGTQTFYAKPKDVIDVALAGIVNVLTFAELCHNTPPDLVLVSSSEVYQDPPEGMFPTDETVPLTVPDVTNPRYSYGAGKIASEVAAMAYSQAGILGRAVIVRPHNIYGPDMGWDHVIPQFAQRLRDTDSGGEFQIQGSGYETRSFCYIDDAVDGLLVAGEHGKDREVYHLGNPSQEYSVRSLAYLMAAAIGLGHIHVVPGERPEGFPVRRCPDIAKLEMLGWRPTTRLVDGLVPTLEWISRTSGPRSRHERPRDRQVR